MNKQGLWFKRVMANFRTLQLLSRTFSKIFRSCSEFFRKLREGDITDDPDRANSDRDERGGCPHTPVLIPSTVPEGTPPRRTRVIPTLSSINLVENECELALFCHNNYKFKSFCLATSLTEYA